jgi:hypothetical protein
VEKCELIGAVGQVDSAGLLNSVQVDRWGASLSKKVVSGLAGLRQLDSARQLLCVTDRQCGTQTVWQIDSVVDRQFGR